MRDLQPDARIANGVADACAVSAYMADDWHAAARRCAAPRAAKSRKSCSATTWTTTPDLRLTNGRRSCVGVRHSGREFRCVRVHTFGLACGRDPPAFHPAFGQLVAGPPDDPRVSREANVALIPLQSTNGESRVADANIEWDKTVLPSPGFRGGAAYNWISQDLDHDNPTLMGDRTLPSD